MQAFLSLCINKNIILPDIQFHKVYSFPSVFLADTGDIVSGLEKYLLTTLVLMNLS